MDGWGRFLAIDFKRTRIFTKLFILQAPRAQAFLDILELDLTGILERQRQPPEVFPCPVGHHQPARGAERFKPRGNVDPVTEHVALIEDDVADVEAHPKL